MINHTQLWLALKRHYWNPSNLWEYEFPPARYLPKGHPNRIKWEQSQVRQTILMHDYIYDLKSISSPVWFTTETITMPKKAIKLFWDTKKAKIKRNKKPMTETFTAVGATGPYPKVGDTLTMGNMKWKVTKMLNKRKSREYEFVMKKIRERQ